MLISYLEIIGNIASLKWYIGAYNLFLIVQVTVSLSLLYILPV